MMAMLSDDGVTPYWMYVGEVETPRALGVPADDRPFVIYDTPSSVYLQITDSNWNRISPVDDATALPTGFSAKFAANGNDVHNPSYDTNLLGLWTVLPTGVYFHDAAGRHLGGFLRNIGSVSADAGSSGTTMGLTWMYRGSNAGSPKIAMAWDGVTAY
jgi:hypothetical protein